MTDYISRDAALSFPFANGQYDREHADEHFIHGCESYREWIEQLPAADVVEVVRCRDCKHRIVNEHFGEKGYMKLKAMCELDTGDPFELGRYAEDDDWFCADGERKDGGQKDASNT